MMHKWRRLFSSRRNWVGSRDNPVQSSPERLTEIAVELKEEAKRLGLGLVGITSPRKSSRFDKYKQWLASNYHGELDYMQRDDRVERREHPPTILPGVQSVVMVGLLYWPGTTGFPKHHHIKTSISTPPPLPPPPPASSSSPARARGIMSSYAWGEDYHKVLTRRLKLLARHLNAVAGGVGRFYVDTGAILERDFAERAKLGFIGKNSLLINPRVGSGFFIGELFSTVALPLDGDSDKGTTPPARGEPSCGKCSRCRVACPTGAIVQDHVVDSRKCISYLTIELKGAIPLELRHGMGARVYGCDICQAVCPWNRIAWQRSPDAPQMPDGGGYSPLFGIVGRDVASPVLEELVVMDDAQFARRFEGSAVKRIGRERMARNAAVALGNVGGRRERDVLCRVVQEHDSQLVREHAQWALHEIDSRLEQSCENASKSVP